MRYIYSIVFILLYIINSACIAQDINLTKDPKFKSFWHQGKAEITSYKLEQARYGEIHSGNAVLIFVTEDFSKKKKS